MAGIYATLASLHFSREGYCNTCGGAYPCATMSLVALLPGLADNIRAIADIIEPARAEDNNEKP